ncbi:MAG: hypothetical protein IKG82_13410 [Oscillospiraceae bacterium]|nr:hypothetical protein [Oscillospiraceae bacterium]
MKAKTAIILIIIACVLGVAHYNDQITISVTLLSPAQFVDTVSKVITEVTKSSDKDIIEIEVRDGNQHSESISREDTVTAEDEIYRVRRLWDDYESQIGAYSKLENAIDNCPIGYYVFNKAGEIVYVPPQC